MREARWGRIALFLIVVFTLSWGLGFLFDGDGVPPLGMFVPALVAIYMRDVSKAHWVFRGFVLLFLVQLLTAVLAVSTSMPKSVLGGIATWSMIGWTLLIIRLYRSKGEKSFAGCGLQLGDRNVGLKIAIGFVLFLVLQGVFDLTLGTGSNILGTTPVVQMDLPAWFESLLLVFMFALSIVGTPLGGLAIFFGEEYGWRGFLQDELEPIGRRQAALLIGLIWGLWHIPIILSGIHTYPPTGPGFLLAALFSSLWGFVQSYAVHKTGSIWTAAVLHGIFNGLFHFLRTYVVKPEDKILSFGLGLYGVICLAFVVLFIWKDPVWRTRPREKRSRDEVDKQDETQHRGNSHHVDRSRTSHHRTRTVAPECDWTAGRNRRRRDRRDRHAGCRSPQE